MKRRDFLAAIISGGLAGMAGRFFGSGKGAGHITSDQHPVFERILKTGELRCSYAAYAPALMVDPNTGELSGIFYDLMNELAKLLQIKIIWQEEVGYGEIIEGFITNRYDIFGGTVWPIPERAKYASFSQPVYFSSVGLYVRPDDDRFSQDYSRLDSPEFIVSVKDGDIQQSIANAEFPRAKQLAIPQHAEASQNFLDVVHGKADATFLEAYYAQLVSEKSGHELKNIIPDTPLRVFANTIMLPKGEYRLKETIDLVLDELNNRGVIQELVNKHTAGASAYLMPARNHERRANVE